jgi:hypothetical protein
MYMAARRMNGVVSPQHAPTIRKPRIQRKSDGCGSSTRGALGSMVIVRTGAIRAFIRLQDLMVVL